MAQFLAYFAWCGKSARLGHAFASDRGGDDRIYGLLTAQSPVCAIMYSDFMRGDVNIEGVIQGKLFFVADYSFIQVQVCFMNVYIQIRI